MDMRRALEAATATTELELRRAYRRAVAHGATNTGCMPDRERAYSALRLLTLATLRMPDLALCAYVAATFDDDGDAGPLPRAVVEVVSDVVAGALRLADRALELHGQSLGYGTAVWIGRALERAGRELDQQAQAGDGDIPFSVEQVRLATVALTRATAATATDPMLVPVEAANGLGHLLAVYLIASAAAR